MSQLICRGQVSNKLTSTWVFEHDGNHYCPGVICVIHSLGFYGLVGDGGGGFHFHLFLSINICIHI